MTSLFSTLFPMKLNKLFIANIAAVSCAMALAAGTFTNVSAAQVANAATKNTQAYEDIKIVKVNDSNFEKEILQSKKPVILEISSTSCPPCLIMIPTLISIAKNYSDIKIASVGIDPVPHCGALVTLLAICGLTHNDSYYDIAVCMLLKFFVPYLCIVFYLVTHIA